MSTRENDVRWARCRQVEYLASNSLLRRWRHTRLPILFQFFSVYIFRVAFQIFRTFLSSFFSEPWYSLPVRRVITVLLFPVWNYFWWCFKRFLFQVLCLVLDFIYVVVNITEVKRRIFEFLKRFLVLCLVPDVFSIVSDRTSQYSRCAKSRKHSQCFFVCQMFEALFRI